MKWVNCAQNNYADRRGLADQHNLRVADAAHMHNQKHQEQSSVAKQWQEPGRNIASEIQVLNHGAKAHYKRLFAELRHSETQEKRYAGWCQNENENCGVSKTG